MIAGRAQLVELWGGIEYTVNRVGERWFDQMVWSGHDRRVEDLSRFASLGITALRYPALWERLAPARLDEINWHWTDERLTVLQQLGVRPILGLLHHGSGPAYTSLLDEHFPEKFARYAAAVAQRYPWVEDYTPINEPLTTARFSGLYGHWYPHGRNDRTYVRALLNQIRGTVLAMRAIREVVPTARLIQTDDCGRTYGTPAMRRQIAHECDRRWLTWDLLTGRVDRRHPLRGFLRHAGMSDADEAFFLEASCPPDIIGLNYYLTSDRYLDDCLERYDPSTYGSNGHLQYADVDAVRARPGGIAGHEAHLLAAWERYQLPVALTEVHLGCTRDEQIRWLLESWQGARLARARGADVRAVTAWALLGSYNWDSLVTRDTGHYEPGAFDVRAPAPRATAIASVVATLASGTEPQLPATTGIPWWRRRDRMVDSRVRSSSSGSAASPRLLIIGASGALGQAFQRIGEVRGLSAHMVGRRDVDIADAAGVDALVRRSRPWAVINAAGYVAVDTAESDTEGCWRGNVAGPVNLAAACRRHAIPFVTYSSDLVFDGLAGRAYTEDDEPRPLNVYGQSKAEAERRVLDLLPTALVVRTSAFFGPWDVSNFLARMFRTLDSGLPFEAATDTTVSPTYLPDLVNASLDLLLDQEHGLWHLANEGAVTWFTFGRDAAAGSGRAFERVVAVDGERAWPGARRPRYSALTSRRGRLLPPLNAALAACLRALAADAPTEKDRCAS